MLTWPKTYIPEADKLISALLGMLTLIVTVLNRKYNRAYRGTIIPIKDC